MVPGPLSKNVQLQPVLIPEIKALYWELVLDLKSAIFSHIPTGSWSP